MARRVLVTGCSGCLGLALTDSLLAHPLVGRVIGTDLRPPERKTSPKFKYYPADIRDGTYLRNLLEEEGIETVYHLAFLTGESKDALLAHSINVDGTIATLEAAGKASRVRKLVIAGSVSAYGARRGNKPFLKEDAPLRADVLQDGVWKRRMEEAVARLLPETRPSLQVSILRICPIASPAPRAAGPVQDFLRPPFGFSALLSDCAMQFIAEEDLLRVMTRILEVPEFRGAFNVAPDGHTTLKTLIRKLQARHLRLPYSLLWLAFLLARRLKPELRLSEKTASSLIHPIVVDNSKVKRTLGVEFMTGSEAAFLACAEARGFPGATPADMVALPVVAPDHGREH